MTSFSRFLAFGAVAVTAAAAQPALANQSSGDMPVTAIVVNNCTISASPMAFGTITDFDVADTDSTSTIALACTPNAAYEVQLNDGINADAGQRRLANVTSTEFINYDIYSDLSRTSRWGDNLSVDTVSGVADAVGVATLTAYGRINQGETPVSAGAYSDLVTVTVNF
jgi:spore coat protein U-like protein